jgi:N-acetylmuramoyl-L-alanine amidase
LKKVESQRVGRLGALLVLLALACAPAFARVMHGDAWAREKFAAAERMREALNGRPAADRTRHDYQRVIDAYRRVYFGAPAATKADPSVVATAELLVEMGRQFDDDKILHTAIEQYEFLRREYPGSKYRFDALFTIGEIYKDDLDDAAQGRSTFEEFIRRYPRHHLFDEAKSAIAELDQKAAEETAKAEVARKSKSSKSTKAVKDEDSDDSPARRNTRGNLARVTGVRHWSTPDYTRVAIDVEQDVKFDSRRLDRPERIFFDLQDTKLASTLVGKSFDVEDGFLKKVRVAQFKPGKTRVVLEVDDLSEYNAFLLSNPTRLIIDIHNTKSARTPSNKERPETKTVASSPEISDSETKTSSEGAAAKRESVAPPLVVAGSKSAVQSVTAEQTVPKKIVEADDDDDEPPPSKTERVSVVDKTKADVPSTRTQGKRKSPDGNNDEVATLDPTDIKPDTRASATSVSTTTERSRKARTKSKRGKPALDEPAAREAQPTASGDRSLIRALGLKIGRIVIDPGHGGHDTGTIGPNGLEEKDLVLEVAKRLGKLLESRLGADVVYTRQDDTFIPLETRTAIANQEQADLFVSIHANSSRDPDARGVETYYLNFTSNANALEVAARENAVSDKSIHELQDLVKKIALKEKIEESREFASDVQQSLHTGLSMKSPGIRDRGVKKAPFIVLIGANMPSILAEISFVSNPTDERKLQTAEYRQRIAESLYRGVSKYVGGLSGIKVASRISKDEGQ